MRRWVRISSGVFVTTLVAAGVIAYTSLFAPPATVFMAPASASPAGDDANNCTSAATPCLTPGRAWTVASAGSTISVANGDYTSGCTLTGTKASDTTFRAADGATVRFVCGISIPTGDVHVVFDGLSLYTISTSTAGSYVTVKNGAITCTDSAPYTLYTPDSKCNARFSITGTAGANHWLFQDTTIGPTYDSSNCGNSGNVNLINTQVSDFTWRRVTFLDSRRASDCGGSGPNAQHTENFYFSVGPSGDTSNILFDSCRFYNSPTTSGAWVNGAWDGSGPSTTALFLTRVSGSGKFSNFVMKNCWFDGPSTHLEGASDANFANGSSIQYSTFPGGLTLQCSVGNCPSGYTDLRLKANIIGQASGFCPDNTAGGVAYDHNLWFRTGLNPTQCGATDVITQAALSTIWTTYVSSGSPSNNFVPGASSPALNIGDTASYPSGDYAATARYCGAAPDAGAYERCP